MGWIASPQKFGTGFAGWSATPADAASCSAFATAATWLTRPPGLGRNGTSPDVVLRLAGLGPPDLARHVGLTVTTEARTVVDLARELPLREAVVTVDHALRVSTPRTALADVLDRQQGWPGIRRARSAVALGDPRSESALESLARVAFADAGLPSPVLQAQFGTGARWLPERVDFWWPAFRTVAEADGLAKYEAATPEERRRRHRKSFEREQRLADHDLELIRFGWEDVVLRPGELGARIRQAFGRGLRRAGRPPVWRAADPRDPYLWPHLPPPDHLAP